MQSHLEKSIFLRSGFFRNEKHPCVAGIAYINADHRLYTKHGVTGEESISSPVTPCFVFRDFIPNLHLIENAFAEVSEDV